MRKASVFVGKQRAGVLLESEPGKDYRFTYDADYLGPPVSLTMPISTRSYEFAQFPPFFEGLLPEGVMLDALLRIKKIDRRDLFAQLIAVGGDMIGNVSVTELT
ncbi:MAG TPA: HipA N-terminal domain-containing protein [Myxococcota bacterium]|nr:HipA N-terminal domain-containing protein [Myxococcota bacterium]